MTDQPSGPPPPPAEAVPVWAGRVSIYPAPDGGYVVAHCRDGGDTARQHIPGWVIKMAERMEGAKGGVPAVLAKMAGRRG